MRRVQSDRNLTQQAHEPPRLQDAQPFDGRPELLAVEKLHCERERAVTGGLEIHDLHDVTVRELLGDLELTLEAFDGNVVPRDLGVKNLDRDVALPGEIERLVHAPHSAVGNDASYLITLAKQRADPRILIIRSNGHLRGAVELLPLDRAEAGVVRIKPSANATRFHGLPD